jgi:hypothetical protein
MSIRTVQFLAIVLLALYLVPAGAHLIALPNKIGMDEQSYFTVQQIYRGWALAGLVLLGALFSTALLSFLSQSQTLPFWFASAGFVLLVAAAVTFFALVYPANQATGNWTHVPENWAALRAQWEYGHAAGAVMVLAAFLATVVASLSWSER